MSVGVDESNKVKTAKGYPKVGNGIIFLALTALRVFRTIGHFFLFGLSFLFYFAISGPHPS